MERKNPEDINFQHYVDALKKKKITWDIFVDFMQDLSYSDRDKLRNLNAILLNELTMNCSDMDKLIYVNMIFLNEFKNHIQQNHDTIEMSESEHLLEDSQESNEETTKEILIDNEPNGPNNAFPSLCKEEVEPEMTETDHENSKNTNMDFSNEETIEDTTEIPTNEDIQMPIMNKEIFESNPSETYEKIFHCDICNKEYKMNFHLKQHIRNVHEGKKNHLIRTKHEIALNKNDTLITNSSIMNLDDHPIIKGHKHCKCRLCGKSFTTSASLKIHTRTVHEGKKDYKCESCGKSFSQRSDLKKHIYTIHEGHKDFKCESCLKSFSEAGNLKKHIRMVHEGHKDYRCESCGKSFTTLQMLENHLHVVHDGQKDHKCESCGKSFTTAQYLKTHIHTVHDGYKNHKCDFCDKSFSQARSLKTHVEKKHK